MSEIDELHGRIAAAMDRIGTGLGALEAARDAAGGGDEDAAQALEEEKLANAQLEERLKKLKGELAELKEAAPAAAGGMSSDSSELEALRAEVELLRNEVGNPEEAAGLKAEVARLTAALDAAHDAPADTDPLEEKIAGLTTENAALQSEITSLQDRLASAGGAEPAADADAELARQNEMLVKLDGELQRLRGANEELVAANEALRAASAQGVADPELINNAMAAEIEGLRAAQATDQAQINAVLARLEPLLEGAAQMPNMPEGEEQ
jgi:predicted nuclease with TOPRIM domain